MGNRKSLPPAFRLFGLALAGSAVAVLTGCSSSSVADVVLPVLTPLAPAPSTTSQPGDPGASGTTAPSASDGTPTASAATGASDGPVYTSSRLAAALLKPSDLGPGWQVQTTPDSKAAGEYSWGCPDSAAEHKIGALPTGSRHDFVKLTSGGIQTGANSYSVRYVVFPDAASARTAQTALESQKQSCAGTHHVARSGDRIGHTDTDDFSAFSASGFTGQRLHEVVVVDDHHGVSEVAEIEARSGNVLIVVGYTHSQTKDTASRHADFAAASDRLVEKSLQNLASAAG